MKDTECNAIGAERHRRAATIATAAAIANAVYNACGVRRLLDSPMSPVQMVRLLAQRQKKG